MSCFHPLHGFKTANGQWTSKWPNNLLTAEPMTVSCRQCSGCRAEYSRQWAMRIQHEASLHLQNSFITLTYNDAHLPKHNSLVKSDFQDFMKRLRKEHPHKKYENAIRYYHCGEYGENFGRPHYHAILFNHSFNDLVPIHGTPNLFKSEELLSHWSLKNKPIGHVSVGAVTFQSAAYVAAYVNKKINGKRKLDHYTTYNKQTGEVLMHRQQEYATMSRRPGIAKNWFLKHYKDAYPSDFLTINGRKMKPPKYYDLQYEDLYPKEMEIIKENRNNEMQHLQHLFTPEALKQKELNHKARMALYKRNKL